MPFHILICLFPDLSLPPGMEILTLFKWVSPANSFIPWEAEHSLTDLPFLPRRGCQLVQLQAVTPWGRGGTGKIPLTVSNASKLIYIYIYAHTLFFFAQAARRNAPSGRVDFCKIWFICEFLLKVALSRFSWSRLREVGAESLDPSGFATRIEVFLPNTGCMGGQYSSKIPWYMVLGLTAPPNALVYVDWCPVNCLKRGKKEGHITLPWSWHHSEFEGLDRIIADD